MPGDPSPIHPPEAYAWWWWLVVAGCVATIVVACWWCRRTLRALPAAGRADDAFESVRRAALERVGSVERALRAGTLSSAEAHQRLSAEIRRFAGIVTNGDADYRVLSELRHQAVKDPRLDAVVEIVARVESAAFGPGPTRSPDGGAEVFARAREVIERWQ